MNTTPSNTKGQQYRTSEAVTEGHPDKIADQIADAILDDVLARDPLARVAVEALVSGSYVLVAGEVTTATELGAARVCQIARSVIGEIGYTAPELGFCAQTVEIEVKLRRQSREIAAAVGTPAITPENMGAGDQGIMIGYAISETPELLPLPSVLAQNLARQLASARKQGRLSFLRPDGKTQVTVEYEDGKARRIEAIVVSAQHNPGVSQQDLRDAIKQEIILPIIPNNLVDENTRFYINPSGSFVDGGPAADTGLTGRKLLVDTYGCAANNGGGALSGKDPTKVDRSGACAVRWAAKNLVASGLCSEAEIELAYTIGVAHPLAVSVTSRGTAVIEDWMLSRIVREVYDFRPGVIIETLQLRKPIYRQVSAYGHFGRPDLDLPWERLDRVDTIRRVVRSLCNDEAL